MGVGLGLVGAGLVSSTFHLRHPERAWRALSQWRSSWLSREGVMALLTFIPAVVFAAGWVVWQNLGGPWAIAGFVMAIGALLTVAATAMIYRSLKTVPRWDNAWTLPTYLTLALATGNLVLLAVLSIAGPDMAALHVFKIVAMIALVVAGIVRIESWPALDARVAEPSAGSATGLAAFGVGRPLDPAHTSANYVQREMVFAVARKHALKLRRIAALMIFVLPFVLIGLSLAVAPIAAAIACLVAASFGYAGVLVERWRFFAEATHKGSLYYGAQRV
jgi:DMSO reductase anchor subunit